MEKKTRRERADAEEAAYPWSVYEPRVQARANAISPDMGGLDVGCRAALREIARLNAELEAARAVVERARTVHEQSSTADQCLWSWKDLKTAINRYDSAAKAGKAVE